MPNLSNGVLRAENERHAATINRVWGERVAWVEDLVFGSVVVPSIRSRMVGGLVPGLKPPPFFAGPAPSQGGK